MSLQRAVPSQHLASDIWPLELVKSYTAESYSETLGESKIPGKYRRLYDPLLLTKTDLQGLGGGVVT